MGQDTASDAPRAKARNVVFALLGAAGLLLKHAYAGPLEQVVQAYGGNFVASFGLYFAAVSATGGLRHPATTAASLTLAAVTAFELADGFGIMANVYDPIDLAANAAGIAAAIGVDLLTRRSFGGAAADARSSNG